LNEEKLFCKILISLKKQFYDVFHYNNITAKLFFNNKREGKRKKKYSPFPFFTKNLSKKPTFSSLNCESI